jgi:hypothetical protein
MVCGEFVGKFETLKSSLEIYLKIKNPRSIELPGISFIISQVIY